MFSAELAAFGERGSKGIAQDLIELRDGQRRQRWEENPPSLQH